MDQRIAHCFWLICVMTAIGVAFCTSRVIAAQGDRTDADQGVDVLAYGPIHEAFAETVAFNPDPGIVIPKAPPDVIEEVPPEQKPEGMVEWIPGYWAWDDDRIGFIWISGTWRVPPPGRQWVPGYWVKTDKGFQWISGYWAPIKASETEYLPEPPESVEVGPNLSAPSSNSSWIPGCWIWHRGRYLWRPGYWAEMQADWVWLPAHYVWTPRGYIFVGGYWDYSITRRGVLFAPVFFSFGVTVRHGFYFTPSFVINQHVFSDCLFLRPRYGHYYFGDYYAANYYQMGIYPWFSLHARRLGYDPIYAHQRWENRHDRQWENRLHSTFQDRREHEKSRPPRKLNKPAFEREHEKNKTTAIKNRVVVPLNQEMKRKDAQFRFKPVNEKDRKEISQREKEVYRYRKERSEREVATPDRPNKISSKQFEPAKVKLPKSPIREKHADRVEKQKAPPNRYKAPEPNPNVEPLKRTFDRPSSGTREQGSEGQGRKSGGRGRRSND